MVKLFGRKSGKDKSNKGTAAKAAASSSTNNKSTSTKSPKTKATPNSSSRKAKSSGGYNAFDSDSDVDYNHDKPNQHDDLHDHDDFYATVYDNDEAYADPYSSAVAGYDSHAEDDVVAQFHKSKHGKNGKKGSKAFAQLRTPASHHHRKDSDQILSGGDQFFPDEEYVSGESDLDERTLFPDSLWDEPRPASKPSHAGRLAAAAAMAMPQPASDSSSEEEESESESEESEEEESESSEDEASTGPLTSYAIANPNPGGITTVVLDSPQKRAGLELYDVAIGYPPRTVVAVKKVHANCEGERYGAQRGMILMDHRGAKEVVKVIKAGQYPIRLRLYNLAVDLEAAGYVGLDPREALKLAAKVAKGEAVKVPEQYSPKKVEEKKEPVHDVKETPEDFFPDVLGEEEEHEEEEESEEEEEEEEEEELAAVAATAATAAAATATVAAVAAAASASKDEEDEDEDANEIEEETQSVEGEDEDDQPVEDEKEEEEKGEDAELEDAHSYEIPINDDTPVQEEEELSAVDDDDDAEVNVSKGLDSIKTVETNDTTMETPTSSPEKVGEEVNLLPADLDTESVEDGAYIEVEQEDDEEDDDEEDDDEEEDDEVSNYVQCVQTEVINDKDEDADVEDACDDNATTSSSSSDDESEIYVDLTDKFESAEHTVEQVDESVDTALDDEIANIIDAIQTESSGNESLDDEICRVVGNIPSETPSEDDKSAPDAVEDDDKEETTPEVQARSVVNALSQSFNAAEGVKIAAASFETAEYASTKTSESSDSFDDDSEGEEGEEEESVAGMEEMSDAEDDEVIEANDTSGGFGQADGADAFLLADKEEVPKEDTLLDPTAIDSSDDESSVDRSDEGLAPPVLAPTSPAMMRRSPVSCSPSPELVVVDDGGSLGEAEAPISDKENGGGDDSDGSAYLPSTLHGPPITKKLSQRRDVSFSEDTEQTGERTSFTEDEKTMISEMSRRTGESEATTPSSNLSLALVEPLDNRDTGIGIGDIVLTVLSMPKKESRSDHSGSTENATVPSIMAKWAGRNVKDAIWRMRKLHSRLESGAPSVLSDPGSVETSSENDVLDDMPRPIDASKYGKVLQDRAAEELRKNNLDRALELYEEVYASYKIALERRRRQQAKNGTATYSDRDLKYHPSLGAALFNIGIVHLLKSSFADAAEKFEESKLIRGKMLGRDSDEYIASLNKQGIALFALGRISDAQSVFEEALAILPRELPSEKAQFAEIKNAYGCSLYAAGQRDLALRTFQQAQTINKILLNDSLYECGDASSELIMARLSGSLNNIGQLGLKNRDYKMAILAFEGAYKNQLLLFNRSNPFVLATLDKLAFANVKRGDSKKALKIYNLMLEAQMKSLGPHHIDCAQTLTKISLVHVENQNFESAQKSIELVVEAEKNNADDPKLSGRFRSLSIAAKRSYKKKKVVVKN